MIWLSLASFAVGAITFQLSRGREACDRWARLAHTLAIVALLIHVAFALHFFHQWDQSSVYRETARQTAEVFDLDWGGGMYVNYAFLCGWLLDVAWWWGGGLARYRRRPTSLEKILGAAWQAFVLFIIFNATFVFAKGVIRWLGLALCLTLGWLWWANWRSRSTTVRESLI